MNTGWQLTVALEKYGGYCEGEDVYPFHYDWRLSALDNAKELATFVAAVRERHDGARVDVVTHSAGALVALAWVKLAGGAPAVRNLILIAPPLRGTTEALRVMARPERFLRRTFSPDVVATWPSVPELLPDDGAIFLDESGTRSISTSGRPRRGRTSASTTRPCIARSPRRSSARDRCAIGSATRRCRPASRCT